MIGKSTPPYEGGEGCGNYDTAACKCKLPERPFNGDYTDVPDAIIQANNDFVAAAGDHPIVHDIAMSADLWPNCNPALTFCRRWREGPFTNARCSECGSMNGCSCGETPEVPQ